MFENVAGHCMTAVDLGRSLQWWKRDVGALTIDFSPLPLKDVGVSRQEAEIFRTVEELNKLVWPNGVRLPDAQFSALGYELWAAGLALEMSRATPQAKPTSGGVKRL
jgi:hypothetical protein